MRMTGRDRDAYEKLLDEMLNRTLQGELIPFDEFLDALDELSEEPERIPTEVEISEAEKARIHFLKELEAFPLPWKQRFTLCKEICRIANQRPSQKLLRLLCYVICDTGVLLDLDRSIHSPAQNALVWPEIQRDAEEMYSILTERKRQIHRFHNTIKQVKFRYSEMRPAVSDVDSLQEKIYGAYVRVFRLKEELPTLRENILCLLQIANCNPVLKLIKPLFLWRALTRHRKRMETEREVHLDFSALWKRQEYNIEENNGKNFKSYVRSLMLFESLYQMLSEDEDIDISLCMAGFDCLSNLGEFYRTYPENLQLLPLGTSVENLFCDVAYSCFEHGYGDNLMMEINHISATKLNRFLAGQMGNHLNALEKISGLIHKCGADWCLRFQNTFSLPDSDDRAEQTIEICQSILDSAMLPAGQRPSGPQETALFYAAINSFLMEAVDKQAEEYLKTAAKLLCGELYAEDQK